MNDPGRIVTLNSTDVRRLRLKCTEMSDDVGCATIGLCGFLQIAREKPEQIDELISQAEMIYQGVNRQLLGFREALDVALGVNAGEIPAQQSAPPNGGPAESPGNPGLSGGPPSVS